MRRRKTKAQIAEYAKTVRAAIRKDPEKIKAFEAQTIKILNEEVNGNRFSLQETKAFEEAVKLHGKNWKLVSSQMQSRSQKQVSNHANQIIRMVVAEPEKEAKYN